MMRKKKVEDFNYYEARHNYFNELKMKDDAELRKTKFDEECAMKHLEEIEGIKVGSFLLANLSLIASVLLNVLPKTMLSPIFIAVFVLTSIFSLFSSVSGFKKGDRITYRKIKLKLECINEEIEARKKND